MKKRNKKYRPKAVALDPLKYVLDGLTPIRKMDSPLSAIQVANHMALANLTKGKGTEADVKVLIDAFNFTEALARLEFGAEYKAVIKAGLDALFAVGKRGAETGRFIMRGPEIVAMNEALELHDAQMDIVTLKDMERATEIVKAEHRANRVRRIKEAS